jgi:hypothetical protein
MAARVTRHERRRAPRVAADHFGLAGVAVVRPGVDVLVVDMSCGGVLVESSSAIRPGARTELAFDGLTGGRRLIGVRALRSWVCRLEPLRYRAALRFDREWDEGSG